MVRDFDVSDLSSLELVDLEDIALEKGTFEYLLTNTDHNTSRPEGYRCCMVLSRNEVSC